MLSDGGPASQEKTLTFFHLKVYPCMSNTFKEPWGSLVLIQPVLSGSPVLERTEPPKEMMSVSALPDGRTKVRVNSSSLAIMQECWRKTNYSLVEGWRANVEGPATVFGKAIHKALEVYYSTAERPPLTKEKTELMEMMGFGGYELKDETDLHLRATAAFVAEAQPLAGLDESDKRSIQTGVWILAHYFKTYQDDPLVVFRDEAGPFVERDFSIPLFEDEKVLIEYFGRVDVVLQNKNSGAIFVADHKTSSIIGNDFYSRLKPNNQYTGYLLGARQAFGIDTDSFLVNCLQVKEKPKTARGTPPHFVRQVTQRDENDFKEFADTVYDFASSYVKRIHHRTWPLGPVNACASYGACQYLPVCSAPISLRTNILSSKFKKVL